MDDNLCLICSNHTIVGCRRDVLSSSTCHILPTLRSFFYEAFDPTDVDSIFANKDHTFVCIPLSCYNKIERIQRNNEGMRTSVATTGR